MKIGSALLLAAASLSLTACTSLGLPGVASEPVAHRVNMGGESFVLRQLTESTWTVNSSSDLNALKNTPAATAAMRQAVEKTSGCLVTDSDYSSQGRQFDAQVECPGTRAR